MTRKGTVSVLLVISIVFTWLPFLPSAAAAPTFVNTCNAAYIGVNGGNCTIGGTIGNLIVVVVDAWTNSASCPSNIGSNSTGGGEAFVFGADTGCVAQIANGGERIWISYFKEAASIPGRVIAVTFSSSVAHGQLTAYEISGVTIAIIGTLKGSGTTTGVATYQSSGSIDFGTAIAVTGIIGGVDVTTMAAGTSFSFISGGGGNLQVGAEYTTSVSVPGPTSFPWQITAATGVHGPWLTEGIAFGTPAPTVTNVVACTFFELQCWWYPMLFFGIGLTPFMLVGGLARLNARGMTYLLLCGLTFTGMVEVLMGMINVMFPLIFTILAILYAVRIK